MHVSIQLTKRGSGFSMTEVLLVAAMIVVLSGMTITAGIRQLQRERVNALAVQLAGWIETVRRASLKGNTCMIQVNSGSITANGTVASTVDDDTVEGENACLPNAPLTVNSEGNSTFTVSVDPATNFGFTPRGTLWPNDTTVTITISLDGGGPSRCVKIAGLLGVVGVGKSSEGTCITNTRF